MSGELENIYFNVTLTNNASEQPIVANFAQSLDNAILKKPEKYLLSVVRFKIPAYNIPIMLWPEPTDLQFSVSLSYEDVVISKELIFIPNSASNDLYGDAIWTYEEMLNIINAAYLSAYADLKAAKPAMTPTVPPYILYDRSTQLFTIYAETKYADGAVETFIYMNERLYILFASFQVFYDRYAPDTTYRINVSNNHYSNKSTVNSIDYYTSTQELPSLSFWNSLQRMTLETNTIPVVPEYLTSSTGEVKPIITDFEPIDGIHNRQSFQFYPRGPIRYYDMDGGFPLSRMALVVNWVDEKDRSHPVYLGPGQVLTVKIKFTLKETEKVFKVQDMGVKDAIGYMNRYLTNLLK